MYISSPTYAIALRWALFMKQSYTVYAKTTLHLIIVFKEFTVVVADFTWHKYFICGNCYVDTLSPLCESFLFIYMSVLAAVNG